MEILETNHAVLTAYEVLRIVKQRQAGARTYNDGRDQDFFGNFSRVRDAREMIIPSLISHSPEGADEEGEDDLDERIPAFCEKIMSMNGKITILQLRNILSVRPRNTSELGCIFPTEEDWGIISSQADDIIDYVNEFFPVDNKNQ